jgi:hypothetical protein
MYKLVAIQIILVSLTLQPSVFAQDREVLRHRILDVVQKNERQWRLKESKSLSAKAAVGFDTVYIEWEAGKTNVDVLVYVFDSEREAKESYPTAFQKCLDCFAVKEPLNKKRPTLGDENRAWEDRKLQVTGIIFRKGRFVAQAGGASIEVAEKLASYVASEMN